MNVSSIVVKTSAEHLAPVIACINENPGCEVHFYDEAGIVIATIEGMTIGEEMEAMKRVQDIPHVLCANLMYSYSEEEITEAVKHSKNAGDPVPQALK